MEPIRDPYGDEDVLAAELREAFGLGPGDSGLEVNLSRSSAASPRRKGRLARSSRLRQGTHLGDFEILAEIGHGGMGVVYRAKQRSLNREVALKVLPEYSRRGRMAVQRFQNEARAAARLHHTNIVPIYAQGEADGRFFYAMELIEGGSLDSAIRSRSRILSPSNPSLRLRGPDASEIGRAETIEVAHPIRSAQERADLEASRLAVQELKRTRDDYGYLARLIAEVAEGLQHAHDAGVIHRDVKPQNLLIGPHNHLHITDFGLARLKDAPGLTMPGEVMGTPAYLSPEQVDPAHGVIDERTDIYSLGVTLYELLTLRAPFEGETREQIITGLRTREPIAPQRIDPQIPKDLQTICLKAMAKDPRARYQTAAQLAEDLRRFAEGRPILSRPAGPLVRTIKWARRHRAATAAIVAAFFVILLAGGLTASVMSARRARAERLLERAYNRLVYQDYHALDSVKADLLRAERLGADPLTVSFLQALPAVLRPEEFGGRSAAIQRLEAVLQADPERAEALYLLACAYDRSHQQAEADAVLARADALPHDSPAAWFFRGMALHYDDTPEAIRSYQEAISAHAIQGEVFLQATYNMARAYNQRMYQTRSIEDFSMAERALTQLIEFSVYGARPYYLLSVAHRLAAEIYEGSQGTREDLITLHYARSLEMARRGQEIDPLFADCYTAEATCLESMGLIAEAVVARTRAIEVATADPHGFCENHHYRWRLYYWNGQYDEALSDIATHRDCLEQTKSLGFFYSHVYPALVAAEMGDMDRAIAEAFALTEENPGSAMAVIWTATVLRLLGEPEMAGQHLDTWADRVDFSRDQEPLQIEGWLERLYGLARGAVSREELMAFAERADQPWKLRGEVEFHVAARELSLGLRDEALAGFLRAYRSFDSEMRYTYHAKLLVRRMQQDPGWPEWIPDSGLDSQGPNRVKP